MVDAIQKSSESAKVGIALHCKIYTATKKYPSPAMVSQQHTTVLNILDPIKLISYCDLYHSFLISVTCIIPITTNENINIFD